MESNQEQPKLRSVKFLNQGKPYTAFVALNTEEFCEVVEDGTGNLGNYKNKIVSVVEGHQPTDGQVYAAQQAFIRVHTSARGPALDGDQGKG